MNMNPSLGTRLKQNAQIRLEKPIKHAGQVVYGNIKRGKLI